VRLKPGAWSSQRHWHIKQEEFIYILSGELTLVTDAGTETLRAGDCAGFKAGDGDGPSPAEPARTPMLRSWRWARGFRATARTIPTST
jgi:hypothetical protein